MTEIARHKCDCGELLILKGNGEEPLEYFTKVIFPILEGFNKCKKCGKGFRFDDKGISFNCDK